MCVLAQSAVRIRNVHTKSSISIWWRSHEVWKKASLCEHFTYLRFEWCDFNNVQSNINANSHTNQLQFPASSYKKPIRNIIWVLRSHDDRNSHKKHQFYSDKWICKFHPFQLHSFESPKTALSLAIMHSNQIDAQNIRISGWLYNFI